MSTSRSDPESRARRRRECATAILILSVLLGVFFGRAILRYDTHRYAFTDFLQQFPLFTVDAAHVPWNRLMGDPSVEIVPWLLFDREMVRHGQLPLWNPYNGGGVPHLAKYSSAVFSPFTVPFYVLPIRLALLVAPFLKLFCLGFFTFLFLREIEVSLGPALVGAVAFQFSGMNVVWLSGPQTGALISLPAAFFFIERFLRRRDDEQRNVQNGRSVKDLAGLTLALLAGLLAGHPETFYFSLLAVVGYAAFRLWYFARSGRSSSTARVFAASSGSGLVLAGILAAGLASLQIVPFLEYLSHSEAITERSDGGPVGVQFRASLLPLMAFPNLLGNPTLPVDAIDRLPDLNFAEITTAYVGATGLFLGLLGLTCIKGRPHAAFFAVLGGLWLLYAFRVPWIGALFRLIPGLGLAPPTRSSHLWTFAVVCLAAVSLDQVCQVGCRSKAENRRLAAQAALFGAVFLAVALAGAAMLLQSPSIQDVAAGSIPFSFTLSQSLPIVISFFGGLAGLIVLALSANATVRRVGLAAVLWAVFLQGGGLLRNFNPTTPDKYFYPVTAAFGKIQTAVGGARLAALGSNTIVSDSNIPYHLAIPNNYDGQWIRDYDRLYRDLFHADNFQRTPMTATASAVRMFGIKYLIRGDSNGCNCLIPDADLERIADIAEFELYRYQPGLGSYFTVGVAIAIPNAKAARARVLANDFDPYSSVVLHEGHAAGSSAIAGTAQPVETISESPTRIVLIARRATAGYLVLTKPFYPGWKARVNGHSAPVLEADGAICAVPVPEGESRIEFFYDPLSWKIGLLLTFLSALTGAILLRSVRRSRPAAPPRGHPR